jgi:hypothetical protein
MFNETGAGGTDDGTSTPRQPEPNKFDSMSDEGNPTDKDNPEVTDKRLAYDTMERLLSGQDRAMIVKGEAVRLFAQQVLTTKNGASIHRVFQIDGKPCFIKTRSTGRSGEWQVYVEEAPTEQK